MKVPNNKLSSLKTYFIEELKNHDSSEVIHFFNILSEVWLGMSKIDLILQPHKELSESEILKFLYGIKDLKNNRPIQYVAGKTWFYGLEILVKEGCLIPRPETEELVDWIVANEKNAASILDIGTGSGCIPLALKSVLKNSKLSAFDISQEALSIAQENAKNLELNVLFNQFDILNWKAEELNVQYDVIISNPPYIPQLDKPKMSNNVLNYEPELALFVENDTPIIFYETIADFANKYLAPNGRLYFEIHESYGIEVIKMLEDKSYINIELRKDMQGKDRMVRAIKK